jgi:DNA modification methylase
MARPLGEFFKKVRATDLYDYRSEFPQCEPERDFLLNWPGDEISADWIITNPPYRLAEEFLDLAIKRARIGVAFFLKVQFLEGIGRFHRLYERRPPAAVFQFSERVPLKQGVLDPEADTNQAYIWMVWIKDPSAALRFRNLVPGPALGWIAPCRSKLERVEDYPPPVPEADLASDMPLFPEVTQ